MRNRIWLVLSLALGSMVHKQATAQSLVYDWLNMPCMDNLNCSNGCSACNLPSVVPSGYFGTGVQWVGVDVCPHPVTVADNAVSTSAWPIAPQPGAYVGVSIATLSDIRIDSIVIRHRRSMDGPQRLKVQFSNDVMQVPVLIGDVDVPDVFEESVFTDLGCLNPTPGNDYNGFVLRFQAYQGGSGEWQVDGMRIVATPCAAQVGIAEDFTRTLNEPSRPYVDVLGRSVAGRPAPGVYIGARKRVHVL